MSKDFKRYLSQSHFFKNDRKSVLKIDLERWLVSKNVLNNFESLAFLPKEVEDSNLTHFFGG